MERIYHRYEYWECYKAGFFNNISGSEKKKHLEKVVELFSNPQKTRIFMNRVVNEWLYSSEHNLTNPALNRVAWLGQSACCIYSGTPSSLTMEAWRLVPKKHQDKANEIAEEIIKEYDLRLTKNLQQCLKFF